MKNTDYDLICKQFIELSSDTRDYLPLISNLSALLFQNIPDINWAGFYLRKSEALILGPFQGKPACMRIESGNGVCGKVFLEDEIQRVDNVHEFPGHIVCDAASNSEIVVPIHDHDSGKVIGVLDIDSQMISRFDGSDEKGLSCIIRELENVADFSDLLKNG